MYTRVHVLIGAEEPLGELARAVGTLLSRGHTEAWRAQLLLCAQLVDAVAHFWDAELVYRVLQREGGNTLRREAVARPLVPCPVGPHPLHQHYSPLAVPAAR